MVPMICWQKDNSALWSETSENIYHPFQEACWQILIVSPSSETKSVLQKLGKFNVQSIMPYGRSPKQCIFESKGDIKHPYVSSHDCLQCQLLELTYLQLQVLGLKLETRSRSLLAFILSQPPSYTVIHRIHSGSIFLRKSERMLSSFFPRESCQIQPKSSKFYISH